jgi:lambda family phage portal protein
LQAIESDQLDMYRLTGNDNNEVRGGVEVDKYGAAVAYWIYPRHPNDYVGMRRETPISTESERIPADRVCHVFEAERARQTRGVSRMAPVLQKMRDLGQYDYAQLIAARAEACIGLLVTTPPTGATGRIGMAVDGADLPADSDGNDGLSMQPLMVARLSAGQDIKPFTPTRPGNVYGPFVEKQLSLIGAGVGLSPEQVSRDFTKGTYSSQRQAMLEDRREFEPLQEMLIAQAMRPIRDEFIRLAVLQGLIQAPGYGRNPDLYTTTEWRGQGWEWIDPRSEADAYETMLRLGLDTKRRILLAKGQDWREVARQRADETKLEAGLGLLQPEANGNGATVPPPTSIVPQEEPETEDDTDEVEQPNANARQLEPQEMT